MSRQFRGERLGAIIAIIGVVYFFIAITWYSSLFSTENMVSRYEWVEACIEKSGRTERCLKPDTNHEEDKQNFYKFIIGGGVSAIVLFGIYKFAEFIFPENHQKNT